MKKYFAGLLALMIAFSASCAESQTVNETAATSSAAAQTETPVSETKPASAATAPAETKITTTTTTAEKTTSVRETADTTAADTTTAESTTAGTTAASTAVTTTAATASAAATTASSAAAAASSAAETTAETTAAFTEAEAEKSAEAYEPAAVTTAYVPEASYAPVMEADYEYGDYDDEWDGGYEESFSFDFASDAADIATGDYVGAEDDCCMPYEPYKPVEPVQARAGLLTAGEWRDNDNYGFWKSLFGQREDWSKVSNSWGIDTLSRIAVRVTNGSKPAVGSKVCLYLDGNPVWSAVTDSRGDAYLFASADGSILTADKVSVTATDSKGKTIEKKLGSFSEAVSGRVDIDTGETVSTAKTSLDLMFMIDTTGSMGDELSYIQKELEDVIKRVSDTNNVSIDLSVNFYRDKGDEYVVRSFEFTSDIQKALKDLAAQEADGGGDMPESVTAALDNGVNDHHWRPESEKLMFLVLDAPPHLYDKDPLPGIMKKAAEKGIRIIPVVSSGADTDTEFLCRSFAVATGGTYTFLTDHSGIGGSHLEPTIGKYEVEKLNDLLVRVISDYFSSKEREPQQLPEKQTNNWRITYSRLPNSEYEKELYKPILIQSERELDAYCAMLNYDTEDSVDENEAGRVSEVDSTKALKEFAQDIDFSKSAIAVELKQNSSGSAYVDEEKGVSVEVKNGEPVFSYEIKYPELCTDDMATMIFLAEIPVSELG